MGGEWGGVNLYGMVRNATSNEIDLLGLQTLSPPPDSLPESPCWHKNPYESPEDEKERKNREAQDPALGYECRTAPWTGKYRATIQKANAYDALLSLWTVKPSMPKGPRIPPGGRDPNDQFPGLPNESTDDAPTESQENLNGYTMLESWTLQNPEDRPKANANEFELS